VKQWPVVSGLWSVVSDLCLEFEKGEREMSVRDYRDLITWQKAMDVVIECYRIGGAFPKSELYGLTSQLQRAAVSVPANIAEGQGRTHTKEFLNHLSIAYGSLMEVETHLQIAARLEYIEPDSLEALFDKCAEVGRLLNGLMGSLNRKLTTDH
jgi:four helix bundle protein